MMEDEIQNCARLGALVAVVEDRRGEVLEDHLALGVGIVERSRWQIARRHEDQLELRDIHHRHLRRVILLLVIGLVVAIDRSLLGRLQLKRCIATSCCCC